MEKEYEHAKSKIKDALKKGFCSEFNNFIKKSEKVIKKIVESGDSADIDLSKILGLIQGLRFAKKHENKKMKKLLMSLIIASIIALSLGFTIKNYASIKEGKNPEEKIKIFIKNLQLEKLKDNPTIKKIRREIKEIVE